MKNDKTPAKKRITLDKDVIADLETTGADAELIRGGGYTARCSASGIATGS